MYVGAVKIMRACVSGQERGLAWTKSLHRLRLSRGAKKSRGREADGGRTEDSFIASTGERK